MCIYKGINFDNIIFLQKKEMSNFQPYGTWHSYYRIPLL